MFYPSEPEEKPSPEVLARYISDLEKRIFEAFKVGEFNSINLRELNVAPQKPRDGDIIKADGVNFDPGSGAGVYHYDGSAYNKL